MSKMKNLTVAVLTAGMLVVGPMSLKAAEVTVGADVVSSYVFRGVTLNADAVIQPSVDIGHASGLGLNVWGNFDLGDDDGAYIERQFSEIDFDLSYTMDLDLVSVSVGYIEYTYPGGIGSLVILEDEAIATGAKADREAYVGVSAGFDALSVGLTVYQSLRSSDGTYANLSLGYVIGLTEEVTLGLNGEIGYGAKGATAGGKSGLHEVMVGAVLGYALENIELAAFINYVDSLDTDVLPSEAIREDVFGGVSLYYSF